MQSGASSGKTLKSKQRWVWTILSWGIGLACLYWVFHDISLSELVQSMRGVQWWWVLPAAVLDLLVYFCAAWEWQFLLRPVGHLSLGQTSKAVFAGRFANDVLPVHAGYVIRLYLASRWLDRGIAAVIPSLVIERIFDALWLVLGIGVTTLFFPLPPELAHTGEVLGGLILAGAAVIGWIILRPPQDRVGRRPVRFLQWKSVRKLESFIQELSHGVRSIGRSYLILAGLSLSILKLVLQALAFLALLQAYDFGFSIWVQLAVFLIAYVGISMPSTPASMGVFQFFCAAGLKFFSVPKPEASGFALIAYVVLTAPLTIAGVVAILRSGLTLGQIRREVRRWQGPEK